MSLNFTGIIIFIAALFAGRIIIERALKLLTEDEKGRLLQGFSKYRIISFVVIAAFLILHFASAAYYPNSILSSDRYLIGGLVLFLLGSTLFTFLKLKKIR